MSNSENDILSKKADLYFLIEEAKSLEKKHLEMQSSVEKLLSKIVNHEMSGTFHEASNYYNKNKVWLLGIVGVVSLALIVLSIYVLQVFNLEEISRLQPTYSILIAYTAPKIILFIILGWVLKFGMSEYRNSAKSALDFKHRQAISDVTPGFQKLVKNDENNRIVTDAFNVLLKTPTEYTPSENHSSIDPLTKILSNFSQEEIISFVNKAKEVLQKKEGGQE